MSNGFALFEKEKPTRVVFAAGGDQDMEDEGLQPPMIRERFMDQSNVFLNADYTNQANPLANTSQWNIGSDNTSGRNNKGFFASRIKKFTPTFFQLSQYAPNINPKNNILEFEMSALPGVTWRATIESYNYTRITTDWCDTTLTVPNQPATYVQVDSASGYAPYDTALRPNVVGDPKDGIIDHILTAMNNAVRTDTSAAYDPLVYGQFIANFSNGYFTAAGLPNSGRFRNKLTGSNGLMGDAKYGRIGCVLGANPAVTYKMTGGNTFQKGLHAWGCSPIPVDNTSFYEYYYFGPVQFQYSRWIDVIMPELCQFSKMQNTGSNVPSNLLVRLYTPKIQNIGLENVILEGYRQQQINMRKDYAMSYLNLEIRDEYGELFEIPSSVIRGPSGFGQQYWPNANGMTIGLLAQL